MDAVSKSFPEDFQECVQFHGHLCPGLVYGYLVANESLKLIGLSRAEDEEIVAICENDSCAVDALQVVLGTTAGKGNLIIRNYGKNAFIVFERKTKGAYRFSKKQQYEYKGDNRKEFQRLDSAVANGVSTDEEKKRQKYLKALDLLFRNFDEVFVTERVVMPEPSFAELAQSLACSECGELTMSSKMIKTAGDHLLCIPCYERLN